MATIEYQELPEFSREFKKLQKKFKTLSEDFEMVKKAAIELFHLKTINNQSTFEIPGINGSLPIFKLKKFACQALKGRGAHSGLRVIYSWDSVILKVVFLEIYYIGDKENEDKSRIRVYIKTINSNNN